MPPESVLRLATIVRDETHSTSSQHQQNLLRVRTVLFNACVDFEACFVRENARDNVSLLLHEKSGPADALPMLFLDALSIKMIQPEPSWVRHPQD